MTSLLAGTVAHGARGGRGVSTSHYRRVSPGLSGTPRHSTELPGNGSHNKCMLNHSASLAMSTCLPKALPGKLDIKRLSPSILYLFIAMLIALKSTNLNAPNCQYALK